MPIQLVCLCGRGMSLPEKYAGQHVQCPNCHAMLRIPSAKENQALTRWFCKCGLRLKARMRTAGRKIRCPRCSAEVTVPLTDRHASCVEENFVLDEDSGVVQLAPEKKPQQEVILETATPSTGSPSPKDEEPSAYPLAPAPDVTPPVPAQMPDAKPAPAAQAPDSAPKAGAKKRKKRRAKPD